RLGSLGFAGALAQPFLQFFASPLGFSRCLLRRRQLAAEFLALFLLTAQFLFKLLAPFGFFPAGCLRLRCRCFRLFGRRFRRLELSAPLKRFARARRGGPRGFAVAVVQPFLPLSAPLLEFFSRSLRLPQPLV